MRFQRYTVDTLWITLGGLFCTISLPSELTSFGTRFTRALRAVLAPPYLTAQVLGISTIAVIEYGTNIPFAHIPLDLGYFLPSTF